MTRPAPANHQTGQARKMPRPVRTVTEPALIPFITNREGEEAAPNNLFIASHRSGSRLYYGDESRWTATSRGVLWGRCSFNPHDRHGRPTGRPQWRLMHPFRQRYCMETMRCQVCAEPARTPLGYIFLAGPHDYDPTEPVITAQPPVCRKHIRVSARWCPHLERVDGLPGPELCTECKGLSTPARGSRGGGAAAARAPALWAPPHAHVPRLPDGSPSQGVPSPRRRTADARAGRGRPIAPARWPGCRASAGHRAGTNTRRGVSGLRAEAARVGRPHALSDRRPTPGEARGALPAATL